jgi:hypothetical protein
MRDEGVRSQSLKANFAIALADNPDNAELSFHLSHLDVENFTGSKLAPHALNHQAADTHVGDEPGMRKRLAMSIHSPNLYRKLNLNSRADSSIHEGIVRHNQLAGNLPGLPQPEYRSAIVEALNQQLGSGQFRRLIEIRHGAGTRPPWVSTATTGARGHRSS